MHQWTYQPIHPQSVPIFRTIGYVGNESGKEEHHEEKSYTSNDSRYYRDLQSSCTNLEHGHNVMNWTAESIQDSPDHGSLQTGMEDVAAGHLKPAFLRLPELVDLLAKEGRVLRWDESNSWYEVLDGPSFEEKFNALRCTRGKRKEQAADRPFARYFSRIVWAIFAN